MAKIKVIDLIMGGEKSSYAHDQMYLHREKKYIYITPYLDEVKRLIGDADIIHLPFCFHDPKIGYFKGLVGL